jgi:hypothetical protein
MKLISLKYVMKNKVLAVTILLFIFPFLTVIGFNCREGSQGLPVYPVTWLVCIHIIRRINWHVRKPGNMKKMNFNDPVATFSSQGS